MDEEEEDDLKLHRASAWAIKEIKESLDYVVSKVEVDNNSRSDVQGRIKNIVNQLNLFQEDPQLLDPHLKFFLPPLIDCFVKLARTQNIGQPLKDFAEVLYVFCKVRGQKVIIRFFNNGPKNLQPLLNLLVRDFEITQNFEDTVEQDPNNGTPLGSPKNDMEIATETTLTWELRYVLTLWISYLIDTPFDLATISEIPVANNLTGIGLPEKLPGVAFQIIRITSKSLNVATREQNAAAITLVKLVLRPDMQKFNLIQSMLEWVLVPLSGKGPTSESFDGANGSLLFLKGLVRSADVDDIITYLPTIYMAVDRVFKADTIHWESVQHSAVSKNLAIKIQCNIVTQLLRASQNGTQNALIICQKMLVDMSALENVIDFLLQALKDKETLVRYAASKALSVITSKMDSRMAEEVTEAIVESFIEDISFDGQSRNVTSANASRWHGLTLTLSHLLFKQSPSPSQLRRVLLTLYDSLQFEQRSTTGNSIGANVRDAANFGLWSLARRYTTDQLIAVSLPSERNNNKQLSTIQLSARHLVVSACLDSAGNVRRGSSAALQELIGRHPNVVHEGIALVQTVDYHAVGLRRRAMVDVAVAASNLGEVYRSALLEGLFGWRGLQAPDALSRNFAAMSIGRLTNLYPLENLTYCVDNVVQKLSTVSRKDLEWRAGLITALAEIINGRLKCAKDVEWPVNGSYAEIRQQIEDLVKSSLLWELFENDGPFAANRKEMNSISSRVQLMKCAIVTFTRAVSACSLWTVDLTRRVDYSFDIEEAVADIFTQCLYTNDALTLQAIPDACVNLGLVLSQARRFEVVDKWLQEARKTAPPKSFGVFTALASIWSTLKAGHSQEFRATDLEEQIINILLDTTCSPDIDSRVMAIRNLVIIVDALSSHPVISSSAMDNILEAFEVALNDYTINERGDIGSHVRLEALNAVEHVWRNHIEDGNPRRVICYRAVQRLALERLDKVRLAAARCLARIRGIEEPDLPTLVEISTYTYFLTASLSLLRPTNFSTIGTSTSTSTSSDHTDRVESQIAFLAGISSSTGAGSEFLTQTARAALHDILANLPITPQSASQTTPSQRPRTEDLSPQSLPSLLEIANALFLYLARVQSSDRLLLPLLDTLAYLLDTRILLHPLIHPSSSSSSSSSTTTTPFPYPTLLSHLQKSHFKSTSTPKLLAAIAVYRGLADIPTLRHLVLKKLLEMLGGNARLPRVRTAVAEALWSVTGDEALRGPDWSGDVKGNAIVLDGLKQRLIEG